MELAALEAQGRALAGSLAEELDERRLLCVLGVAASWLSAELQWGVEHEELWGDEGGILHQPGCSRVLGERRDGEDEYELVVDLVDTTALAGLLAGYELRRCCFPDAPALRGWGGSQFFDARAVVRLSEVAEMGVATTGIHLLEQLTRLLAERIDPLQAEEAVVRAHERAVAACRAGCAADEVSVLADLGCRVRGELRRGLGGPLPPRSTSEDTHCALVVVELPAASPAALGVVLAGEVVVERGGYAAVVLPEAVRSELVLPGASVRVPRDLDLQRVSLALDILAGEGGGALSGGRLRRALRSAGEALAP